METRAALRAGHVRSEPTICPARDLTGGVDAALPLTTPWRVVMVADSPGRLLENNFLLRNLNDPCAYDAAADARAVDVDPARSKGPLDLREVIRYANQRGIGIILYVNRRAMERQLDEILPL